MKNFERIAGGEQSEAAMLMTPWHDTIASRLHFFRNEKITHDLHRNKYFINSFLPAFPGESWNRFLAGVAKVEAGERALIHVDATVTGNCQCSCWHCYRGDFHDRSDLDPDVVRRFFCDARDLGASIVSLQGGEPMMHGGLKRIISSIPDGMDGQLYTSGYNVDEAFVSWLEGTNVTRCLLSLDHYDPDFVKSKRNYPSAFDDAVRAATLCAQSTLYTLITACLTDELCREEELRRYIDFVGSIGASEIRFVLPVPQGRMKNVDLRAIYKKGMFLTRKLRQEMHHDLSRPNIILFNEMESAFFLGCGAGCQLVTLNNDGSLLPCVAVPLSFGNVIEEGLKEVYSRMGRYYRGAGRTCLSRRVRRAMRKMGVNDETMPLDRSTSERLASRCMVRRNSGQFYMR